MCKRLIYVACVAAVLAMTPASHALVIGNWEQSLDGWTVGTTWTDNVKFDDTNGVTLGKYSLGFHLPKNDWNQGIVVLNVLDAGLLDAFKANQKLTVDVSYKIADYPTGSAPGWNGVHLIVNAGGDGWSVWKTSTEQANWTPRYNTTDATLKATFDYSQWFSEMKNLDGVTWLELLLVSNANDTTYNGPITFYLDNMQLIGAGKALPAYPANNAKDIATDVTLKWTPGTYAASHHLYLGTSLQAVTDAQGESDPTVTTADLTSASYKPSGLKFNTRYYWRVDEVNDFIPVSPWVGSVWNFTTGDFISVDDFESYNDDCGRIFFAWVDGFGYSASTDCSLDAFGGNGTGSTVGNTFPPFAEKTVFHSGSQCMPVSYDNNGMKGYSETERTFAAPLNLTQVGSYDTLKIYVRGQATNDADKLYFRLEDSAGKSVVVAYPDSTVLTKEIWAEWLTPLADLKSINLASVAKMAIGVGDPGSPERIAGRFFVDDIRVGAKPLGLAAYYACEGDAKDSSGNGLDGVVAGDATSPITFVTGPTGFGKAMSFTGVQGSQFVDLGNRNPSSPTGQLTVALWAKWAGLNEGWQGLIGKRISWGADTMMWQIEADRPTGNLQFQSGLNAVANNNGAPLPLNQWTHVAVTFDGANAAFYINAQQTGTGAFTFGYLYDAPFVFGASGANPDAANPSIRTGVNPFNGILDEIRVYDKALSADEIAALMVKK